MINLSDHIKKGILKILVKPNKKENKIIGFDETKKAVIVEIKAAAEDNKANLEIIKFFSKLLKKEIRIKSGFTNKEKILFIK
jgi:uncharacterized protein (TIGR00251 family)